MRVIVYCFSGTGNTRWACDSLARELMALGHSAEVFSIPSECASASPAGYDAMIVGYPVHAFNAPVPVLKFLKKLPRSQKNQPVWLVRTSGEPLKLNNASGITPKRILKRRGYRVKGELHYVMPYNIIFRHPDGMAVRMKRAAERVIPQDAASIAAGEGTLCKNGPFRRMVSFTLRIEHSAMPFIGAAFKTAESCVGCGLCARVCPQGNIQIVEGKPVFGKQCAGCMGCAFHCPKDAIRTSLLNGWRVNGEYAFAADPAPDPDLIRYCRKSYLRYFHNMEER